MRVYFFGKKTIASVIIVSVISLLTISLRGCDITEKDLLKFYYEIQKQLGMKFPDNGILKEVQRQLNDKIIKDPILLDYKVHRDVDDAIRGYERWESSLPPRMTNKSILEGLKSPRFSEGQRMLVKDAIYYECPEGIIGIRGAWVDKDPKCN